MDILGHVDLEARRKAKMRKMDRVIELEPIDGKATGSTGLVDPQLFTGENNLRAVHDPRTRLWSFRYNHGGLPPALRNKSFTSFDRLKQFAENYFKKRNVKITKVID